MVKYCRGCATAKPIGDFAVRKDRSPGSTASACKDCAARKSRLRTAARTEADHRRIASVVKGYRASNPEQVARGIAASRRWARANPDKVRAAQERYKAAHANEIAEVRRLRVRAAYQADPTRAVASSARRRARAAGAPVNDWTAADWQDVLEQFNHSCGYCLARGVPLQQEHMQPLSRGGNHSRDNIIPACAPCNLRKGTKTLIEVLM